MTTRTGYLLAIDVGSTTTRAVLFDLAGTQVAEAFREPVVHHPEPNWAEVQPDDWWRDCTATIRELLARSGIPADRILGIGLTALQHTLVPVDAQGNVLAPAILWMDQRSKDQLAWLNREHAAVIAELLGGTGKLSNSTAVPKLRWMLEHTPEVLEQAEMFLPVKDFIRYRLTGLAGTDAYDAANTGLVCRPTGTWFAPLLTLVGVHPDRMPPILEAGAIAGHVTQKAARETGLAAGTPVAVGSGDVNCTCIGTNVTDDGRACLYLGTAAWIRIPCPSRPGGTVRATATTGAALKWVTDLFACSGFYTPLLGEAAEVPPGSRGLLFLPHLMGERGPQPDPDARGTLYGLTLAHGRADITRAVLEGCAYQLLRIVEDCGGPPLREMAVVGGGAKSPLWLDIIADVLGIRLVIPQVREAGALGAAILAGVGVGVYKDARLAATKLTRIERAHDPDSTRHALYRRNYKRFVALERGVSPLYSGSDSRGVS